MKTIIAYNEHEVKTDASLEDLGNGYNMWIDLVDPDRDELLGLANKFNLDPDALEAYFNKSKKPERFHFGYHKVESFAALVAAIGMIAIGGFILYHSYESFLHPRVIQQPILTMIVLACAGAISLHRAFQMRIIAHKYEILSLKTDAKNSIKDGSASVKVFSVC